MTCADAFKELSALGPLKALDQPLHVVLNRTSGAQQGGPLFDQLLAPLLSHVPFTLHDQKPTKGMIPDWEATVLLIGGDGTLGDVVATLDPARFPSWSLVLLPFGTANAFYHFLFSQSNKDPYASLRHWLTRQAPRPMALAAVDTPESRHVAHVVVSTAFHANLLHAAEGLRDEYAGIERFKAAAAQAWGSFFHGRLGLYGAQRYDHVKDGFGPPSDVSIDSPGWMYLNACLTDRLEEHFVIAPKRTLDAQGVDVVAIRKPDAVPADAFWTEMTGLAGAVYQNGKHVALTWNKEGKLVDGGAGEPAVEYYRCASLGWTPSPSIAADDTKQRLLCIDGALINVASTVRISRLPNDRLAVHA